LSVQKACVITQVRAMRPDLRAAAVVALTALACALVPLAAVARLVRSRRTAPRSVWLGAPILNLANLCRAERSIGADAKTLVTSTYYISSDFDYDRSRRRSVPVLGHLVQVAVFLWLCATVDRLHLYCDRGALPSLRRFGFNAAELRVYEWLRIQTLFWTYGADVRSRQETLELGDPNCCTECPAVGVACICDSALQAANIARIRHHATVLFSMGDMIEYTPGSRNDVFFWAIDIDAGGGKRYRPAYPDYDGSRPLRVVHAPNHRAFKGTRFLEQAVAELRGRDVPIELVMVERMSNEQALDIYRSADVIFDQCMIGFHGYFALEGMALGKPVMCFVRKPLEYLLDPEHCPLINVTRDTIASRLEELVAAPARLRDAGVQGRRYVERHFTIDAVAARMALAYSELGLH
jgi:hypothetical protein